MMNKFINDPDNLTAELLEGYVMAYSNQVVVSDNVLIGVENLAYIQRHLGFLVGT